MGCDQCRSSCCATKVDTSFNETGGEIGLGIDPFFYFERLSQSPGAPPLIFEWSIAAIDMQTAPFIEMRPGLRERDRSLRGWKRIAQTEAWRDDDGNAEYLLHCMLKSRVPRYSLTT